MINWALYKRGLQSSWKLLLVLSIVLTMYFTIIISMFDPNLGSALNEFAKAMPELMAMVGMNPASADMIHFLSSYLYGFIMLVFPMVFSMISANKLVARQVERGSMTYLIAAPVKRSTVVFTQMKVMATGIFTLIAYATILGIVTSEMSFPGELAIHEFVAINIGALCLHLLIGGICFLCSCLFGDTKYSLGFGSGIPLVSFLIQMLANAGEKMTNIKYLTFFSLYNTDGIIAGEASAYLGLGVLFVGAIVLYGLSIVIFNNKDLHI